MCFFVDKEGEKKKQKDTEICEAPLTVTTRNFHVLGGGGANPELDF